VDKKGVAEVDVAGVTGGVYNLPTQHRGLESVGRRGTTHPERAGSSQHRRGEAV